jgi:hypothetical protein
MAVIALDWDGTLVEAKWPDMGDWLPGAVEAVHEMLRQGHKCYIYSARLSPVYDQHFNRGNGPEEKPPGEVLLAIQEVRDKLDEAGLQAVDIWTGVKPFWTLLIDDKAMNFPGRPRSWKRILPRVLIKVDKQYAKDQTLHG